jgi:hypothetical protein
MFMDAHDITGGAAMNDVAKAHLADLQTQAVRTTSGTCGTGTTSERAVFCHWTRQEFHA